MLLTLFLSPPLRFSQFTTDDDDFDEIPDAYPASLCVREEEEEEEVDANHRNKEKTVFSLKLLLRVFDDTNNKDDAAL